MFPPLVAFPLACRIFTVCFQKPTFNHRFLFSLGKHAHYWINLDFSVLSATVVLGYSNIWK